MDKKTALNQLAAHGVSLADLDKLEAIAVKCGNAIDWATLTAILMKVLSGGQKFNLALLLQILAAITGV